MKKRTLLSVFALMLSSITVMAATKNTTPIVTLYSEPNTGKVVETVPITTYLTPIFRQQDWLKVGDSSNGQVGWININQYSKIRNTFYTPAIQTIYVNRSDIDKNGKATVTVIAYRNGKKVSDGEAKELYNKLLAEQAKEQAWQQHYWDNINRMIQLQQQEMDHMFDSAMPIALMPGPVILAPHPKK